MAPQQRGGHKGALVKLTTKVTDVVLKVVGWARDESRDRSGETKNTPGGGGEAQQWRPNGGKRKRRHPDNSYFEGGVSLLSQVRKRTTVRHNKLE